MKKIKTKTERVEGVHPCVIHSCRVILQWLCNMLHFQGGKWWSRSYYTRLCWFKNLCIFRRTDITSGAVYTIN
jgi:hypothetical protein